MKAIKEFNKIIDRIENRCMAADGPVMPTLEEMTEEELSRIWHLLQEIKNTFSKPEESEEKALYKCYWAGRLIDLPEGLDWEIAQEIVDVILEAVRSKETPKEFFARKSELP